MNRAELRILKQPDKVGLDCFLKSIQCCRLHAISTSSNTVQNWSYYSLKWCPCYEKPCIFLVLLDFAKCDRARSPSHLSLFPLCLKFFMLFLDQPTFLRIDLVLLTTTRSRLTYTWLWRRWGLRWLKLTLHSRIVLWRSLEAPYNFTLAIVARSSQYTLDLIGLSSWSSIRGSTSSRLIRVWGAVSLSFLEISLNLFELFSS